MRPLGVLAVLAAGMLAAACGGNSGGTSSNGGSSSGGKASSTSTAVSHLTDSKGDTLYLFVADKGTTSACYGTCATYWPPVKAGTKIMVSGGGSASGMVGSTARTDGSKQATYEGHPLYLYSGDQAPGQTSGQGLNLSGGLWWMVSPSGAAITTSSGSSPSSSPSSSNKKGGGYY